MSGATLKLTRLHKDYSYILAALPQIEDEINTNHLEESKNEDTLMRIGGSGSGNGGDRLDYVVSRVTVVVLVRLMEPVTLTNPE